MTNRIAFRRPLIGIISLAAVAALAFAPPSGRPPAGPLQRYDPKLYDMTFSVTVSTLQKNFASDREFYNLQDAPIIMPVIDLGAFSKVQHDSINGHLWLEGNEDLSLQRRIRFDEDQSYHTSRVVLTVANFHGQSLRWLVGYRVQSWSSKLDEKAAQNLTWPKEWSKEVADGLAPQAYVESDDEVFKKKVEDITRGRIRMVSPYLAAKELIRWCVLNVRVFGDPQRKGIGETILGLELIGAKAAMDKGSGTSLDLTCVCVAMLKAAGIPARPVIGIMEDERDRTRFVVWAEFYMDNCGWIPFDPDELRSKNLHVANVYDAWPELGTMKHLNERIPLAYNIVPVAAVQSPQYPAVWGWDPRPQKDPGSEQVINLGIISRGKGEDDPK
ncbi:MAG TPA: transglutaminase-like domain-containing protein [Phycisphaerales bacterium]|nr:transglutaminase-like domain-containing protein [Phycisphaerales bacterium]